jgi:hypothetical protein
MPKSTTSLGRTLENDIAAKYGGRRSPSSGASAFDKGDVRFDEYLAECKTTEAKSFSFKLATWDKAKQEALDLGKEPVMFVRFFDRDTGRHRDFKIEEI